MGGVMRYVIFGCGGFGREIAPLAAAQPGCSIVVFADDAPDRPTSVNGLPVIGFEEIDPADKVVIAVGDGKVRQTIEARCLRAGLFVTGLSASTTRNLADNQIGGAAVLCDNVTITSNVTIGQNFQANIYSYIAHDCVIGDYVTFAPRVSCNGAVQIGDFAYIGTGAIFAQGAPFKPLTVGEGAIVGMGAVVTKSVPPYTVVVGNPARAIRTLSPAQKV
jgi:sugar O-acyltransferase (sialic acid O-acetyltransferase NeuD family)